VLPITAHAASPAHRPGAPGCGEKQPFEQHAPAREQPEPTPRQPVAGRQVVSIDVVDGAQ
jgi:hypothetical protein